MEQSCLLFKGHNIQNTLKKSLQIKEDPNVQNFDLFSDKILANKNGFTFSLVFLLFLDQTFFYAFFIGCR